MQRKNTNCSDNVDHGTVCFTIDAVDGEFCRFSTDSVDGSILHEFSHHFTIVLPAPEARRRVGNDAECSCEGVSTPVGDSATNEMVAFRCTADFLAEGHVESYSLSLVPHPNLVSSVTDAHSNPHVVSSHNAEELVNQTRLRRNVDPTHTVVLAVASSADAFNAHIVRVARALEEFRKVLSVELWRLGDAMISIDSHLGPIKEVSKVVIRPERTGANDRLGAYLAPGDGRLRDPFVFTYVVVVSGKRVDAST